MISLRAFLCASALGVSTVLVAGCGGGGSSNMPADPKDLPPDKQAEIQNSDAYYDSVAPKAKKKAR